MKITTVTSSCSRAIVHSDWIVYIAEPSASSAITGRSGHATAAPTADGQPLPDRAAGERQHVVPRRSGRVRRRASCPMSPPRRRRSRPRAGSRRSAWQTLSAVSAPVGGAGRFAAASPGIAPFAPSASASASSAPDHVVRRRRELVDLAPVGHEVALLARVGEERHGRLGVDQHQVLEPARAAPRRARRTTRSARRPAAPRRAACAWGRSRRAAWRRSRPRSARRRAGRARAARGRRAGSRSCRRCAAPGDRLHRGGEVAVVAAPAAPTAARASAPSVHDTSAGRISVATCPGGPLAAAIASTASRAKIGSACRGPHPARDVARDGLDVGLQRRVVLDMVGRVVADDVDDRHLGAARVVQVRQPVAQARPEVQQRRRGPIRHPRVAVGGAGGDALEQAEHRTHLRHGVERGDEMHLRRAGVGEARRDAAVDERADQCLGAVGHAARDHR